MELRGDSATALANIPAETFLIKERRQYVMVIFAQIRGDNTRKKREGEGHFQQRNSLISSPPHLGERFDDICSVSQGNGLESEGEGKGRKWVGCQLSFPVDLLPKKFPQF